MSSAVCESCGFPSIHPASSIDAPLIEFDTAPIIVAAYLRHALPTGSALCSRGIPQHWSVALGEQRADWKGSPRAPHPQSLIHAGSVVYLHSSPVRSMASIVRSKECAVATTAIFVRCGSPRRTRS